MKSVMLIVSMIALLQIKAPAQNVARGPVMAHYLQLVSAEFVVDVYHNGTLVPFHLHQLQKEVFGAQIEKVLLEIHEGDWLVFHVVNNGLRDGFPRSFFAAGMIDETHAAFVTDPKTHRWYACDEIQKVPHFITDRADKGDGNVQALTHPWKDGDKWIHEKVPGWKGAPIWGTSHSSWLKYIVVR